MPATKYYRRFGYILNTNLTRSYLRWAYQTSINDLKQYDYTPNFKKKNFTALLCGVGHESTAQLFIDFVLAKNRHATIYIIDLGKDQITGVNKLVKAQYSHAKINVHQMNALELPALINEHSIDWIETDGFIEYFDTPSLRKLFLVWNQILGQDGCITLRDCITSTKMDMVCDRVRVWVAKQWLGVDLYVHTLEEFEALLKRVHYKYTTGNTGIPTFHRYSFIRDA